MSDLEEFRRNEMINVPHLIRVAISHYQFGAIHPFLETTGNQRNRRYIFAAYFNLFTRQ